MVGFRTRSAIRITVEEAAQRYANAHQVPVKVYGVQGGYEARSPDRGAPKGSVILLATVLPQAGSKKPVLGQPVQRRPADPPKPDPKGKGEDDKKPDDKKDEKKPDDDKKPDEKKAGV